MYYLSEVAAEGVVQQDLGVWGEGVGEEEDLLSMPFEDFPVGGYNSELGVEALRKVHEGLENVVGADWCLVFPSVVGGDL